jgi:hypothetical protein
VIRIPSADYPSCFLIINFLRAIDPRSILVFFDPFPTFIVGMAFVSNVVNKFRVSDPPSTDDPKKPTPALGRNAVAPDVKQCVMR